jgi:hypothetical protein
VLQLNCGDTQSHTISRLGLRTCTVGFHSKDRYGGCPIAHSVLKTLMTAIDTQAEAGYHSLIGPGMWVEGLDKQLEEAGLRYEDIGHA